MSEQHPDYVPNPPHRSPEETADAYLGEAPATEKPERLDLPARDHGPHGQVFPLDEHPWRGEMTEVAALIPAGADRLPADLAVGLLQQIGRQQDDRETRHRRADAVLLLAAPPEVRAAVRAMSAAADLQQARDLAVAGWLEAVMVKNDDPWSYADKPDGPIAQVLPDDAPAWLRDGVRAALDGRTP